jgi:sarcosine oxidase subunit alpha
VTRLDGGLIDRSKQLTFDFDGRRLHGFAGDTLASALLANDVRLVGRSFKYHRPRGVFSAGSEEPNALVTLGEGAHSEPNARATTVELFDGLVAKSQNRWPSLSFDVMAVNDLLSPFLTAGFYYKTFMWPAAFWEKLYEPAIRRAAGLGRLSMAEDNRRYDKGYLHCDLLVIGGGPAGLAAALTAARSGASVIVADEDFRLGGRLLGEAGSLTGMTASAWITALEAEFASLPNLHVMRRTTVFGAFDHGTFAAVEHNAPLPDQTGPAQTLWQISARRSLLASGATERPIAFEDNDRPGIMLAGAARTYANRFAASAGKQALVFCNNDDGHRTARDLLAEGVAIAGVVDVRTEAKAQGDYRLIAGGRVIGTRGRLSLSSAQIEADGRREWVECDMLAVAGGWNPNVQLASHQRGRPQWNENLQAFLPPPAGIEGMVTAGAAAGKFSTAQALSSGAQAAREALADLGITAVIPELPEAESEVSAPAAFFHVPTKRRAWVDFQNDVTVKDIKLAHDENMRSVEHLKRYTTLGMATDQGRTANVVGLAVMAELTGQSIDKTGTTIFRPPYTPVSLGVLGGGNTGKHFRPRRLTPTHDWAESQGAVFVEAGQWMRAQYFPKPGESHWRETVDREALAVRRSAGVCDVTTLGKIDVQGRDAAAFLDRVYANTMSTLKPGRVRYGLMLREDGFAFDDGTCARLHDDHFVVTTTTANSGSVYRHMEFVRQCLLPELDVHLISTTDAWAQIAVAGPNSRKLLQRLIDDHDISNDAFPFMACAEMTICGGLNARLFRISFSGELAFELAVPARYGNALMARLIAAGRDLEVTPYGTETLGVLRIEKGHAAGSELNGQTTPTMLGMEKLVSAKKDCVGAIMSRRPGLADDKRRLVGLKPVNPQSSVVPGAHLFAEGKQQSLETDEGWITSACYSPHIGSMIGLGFLESGDRRMGETIVASNPVEGHSALLEVVPLHFVDPSGERLKA